MSDADFDRECFFIAPIGDPESDIRQRSDGVLRFIVRKAAEEIGLVAVRADAISEPGQITVQVIEHLLNARAAVADLTGLNANVFYELAVRHTAKLPTVLICEEGTKLPFDIAQMRTIFFNHHDLESADQCRERIVQHLKSSLEGAVDSPIATTIDLKFLESGSAVERTVADLAGTVSSLAGGFTEMRDYLDHLGQTIKKGERWAAGPGYLPQAAVDDLLSGRELLRLLEHGRVPDQTDESIRSARRAIEYVLRSQSDADPRIRQTSERLSERARRQREMRNLTHDESDESSDPGG